jgi:hypothetical protein
MKQILCIFLILVLAGMVSGCAGIPLVLDNGAQRRIFTPCTNDNLCFRDTYDVSWDSWCNWCNWGGCGPRQDFPVTYRTKQVEYEGKQVEYIYAPRVIVSR